MIVIFFVGPLSITTIHYKDLNTFARLIADFCSLSFNAAYLIIILLTVQK